jgi:hypothetical protein
MKQYRIYKRDDETGNRVKADRKENIKTVVPKQFPQGDCANPNRHAAHGSCRSGVYSALQSQKEVMGKLGSGLKLQAQAGETMRGNELEMKPLASEKAKTPATGRRKATGPGKRVAGLPESECKK